MNRYPSIIIKISLAVVLLALASQLIAHGGMEHIKGTVVKVDNGVVTVKTAQGNVDVKLNDKTEFTNNSQPAQLADLKPGSRVVIHAMKQGADQVAHSVAIGVASAHADHK
jgi:hypothetical protein